ncbi:MAG: pyruvate dehydrogenase complex dihydrolipoamide acetyltransferase [Alphaproteobacteria bacterium]
MPIKVLMPALSPTMEEGNLVKWVKNEGDTVESGDVIAEIETDKATMEVESIDDGILGKIIVPAGTDNVPVNKLIAVILEEDEDASALEGISEDDAPAPAAAQPQQAQAEEQQQQPAEVVEMPAQAAASGSTERVFATPLARRMADQAGIDIGSVQGSGPRGRIIKADIESYSGGSASTAPAARPAPSTITRDGGMPSYQHIPVSGMRKVIAQRLTESKQTVPHFYLTIDCAVDKLMAMRKEINESLEDGKLTVNDIIIKACAAALMKVPEANASWFGDHVRQYDAADVAVAVAMDGGLVTPVVREADRLAMTDISGIMKDFVERGRAGKLQPEEYQGGTFTLSNMGMYGIKHFEAIINPPQGCILAVGSAAKTPVVRDNGDIEVDTIMSCTLSVDHRVIDGSVGAEFLNAIRTYIQNPMLMLV